MLRIAVLISGGGTNLQAIIDACENQVLDAKVIGVISNKENAFGLERAKKHGIAHDYIGVKRYSDVAVRNEMLLNRLNDMHPDLIVLAGYLSILSPKIIKAYEGKIINIHPSLIPKHCGKGFYGIKVHESVIESKDVYSGATVHFVDAGVDTGTIILQEALKVSENETPASLQKRVLEIEHRILIQGIQKFCSYEL
ncbi:MAG: phosphoribosylglycinamide formyltransferase [Clostridia bacterium]|nr:phosphoribosylglycinamide formyltransferase [Clostridia bacterium]